MDYVPFIIEIFNSRCHYVCTIFSFKVTCTVTCIKIIINYCREHGIKFFSNGLRPGFWIIFDKCVLDTL